MPSKCAMTSNVRHYENMRYDVTCAPSRAMVLSFLIALLMI